MKLKEVKNKDIIEIRINNEIVELTPHELWQCKAFMNRILKVRKLENLTVSPCLKKGCSIDKRTGCFGCLEYKNWLNEERKYKEELNELKEKMP